MRKLIGAMLVLVLYLESTGQAQDRELWLVKRGKPAATIVVPRNPGGGTLIVDHACPHQSARAYPSNCAPLRIDTAHLLEYLFLNLRRIVDSKQAFPCLSLACHVTDDD